MPTPAKKGRKSHDPDDQDPMSPMRDGFAKLMRPNGGRLPYLENVFSSTQELLKSNNETFNRCKNAFSTKGNKLLCQVLLTKREFEYVRCHHVDGKLLFTATPEYCEKEFDITPLIKLPKELDLFRGISSESGLIDYESLFETSSVLHGDIVIPFLAHLKKQLVSVQTCLNGIENWWNEVSTNLSFLESIFGPDVAQQAEELRRKDPLCRNCRRHFSRHSLKKSDRCPDEKFFKCCTGFGLVFKRSDALPLKTFITSTSKINDKFSLSSDNERERLIKLVRFLSHN